MNKHILLAMKWLDSPNSVSKEELKKNAADAAAADAAAVYAAAVYDAAVYAAYAEMLKNGLINTLIVLKKINKITLMLLREKQNDHYRPKRYCH